MLKKFGEDRKALEILSSLFTSKTRIQILTLFIKNPNTKFYQREIVYRTGERITPVQYELKNLVNLGFLNTNSTRTRRFYELNENFILKNEIAHIFEKLRKHT